MSSIFLPGETEFENKLRRSFRGDAGEQRKELKKRFRVFGQNEGIFGKRGRDIGVISGPQASLGGTGTRTGTGANVFKNKLGR